MMQDPSFPPVPFPDPVQRGAAPAADPAAPDGASQQLTLMATPPAAGPNPFSPFHRQRARIAGSGALAMEGPPRPQSTVDPAGADSQFGVPGCKPLKMAPDPRACGGATSPAGMDYVPARAMEDVLALRHSQIHRFGHTLDADLGLIERTGKRYAVAMLAREALKDAIEDMMFNKDFAQIRRRLVKAAALTLAAIDAEDARHG